MGFGLTVSTGHGAMRCSPPIYPLTLYHQRRRRSHWTAADSPMRSPEASRAAQGAIQSGPLTAWRGAGEIVPRETGTVP